MKSQAQMPSQEQEQQDAREHVPTMGSEGERQSRQGQGPGQKKRKKNKMWSPVSRHHVVASLVSRSQAARRASPAARKASPAGTPQAAAVLESLRTPTFIHNDYVPYSEFPEPMDDSDRDAEDDSDRDSEDNFDLDAGEDVEGDEQHVEDVAASASIRALTSKFRSKAWKEYVPVIVDGQISDPKHASIVTIRLTSCRDQRLVEELG